MLLSDPPFLVQTLVVLILLVHLEQAKTRKSDYGITKRTSRGPKKAKRARKVEFAWKRDLASWPLLGLWSVNFHIFHSLLGGFGPLQTCSSVRNAKLCTFERLHISTIINEKDILIQCEHGVLHWIWLFFLFSSILLFLPISSWSSPNW